MDPVFVRSLMSHDANEALFGILLQAIKDCRCDYFLAKKDGLIWIAYGFADVLTAERASTAAENEAENESANACASPGLEARPPEPHEWIRLDIIPMLNLQKFLEG